MRQQGALERTYFRSSILNMLGPETSRSLNWALNSEPRSMLTVLRASGSIGGMLNPSEILPLASRGRNSLTACVIQAAMLGSFREQTLMEDADASKGGMQREREEERDSRHDVSGGLEFDVLNVAGTSVPSLQIQCQLQPRQMSRLLPRPRDGHMALRGASLTEY